MTEACAYTSPSREPADIAERLRAYIARNEAHARRHVEGETDLPKIQHGYVAGLLTGIKRMEHQMRCFILFLAAQLIERGLVKPQPLALYRRGEPDPSGPSAFVRREDRALRRGLSNRVQLSPFSITTPVFERRGRRRKPRVKSIYKLLPSSVQPVDARHLLARYGRLSSVLLRADTLAERLAGRALTVKLNAGMSLTKGSSTHPTSDRAGAGALSLRNNSTEQSKQMLGQPASALSSFHVSHQAHGNNPEWAEPPRGVRHDNAGMSINCRSAQAEGGADNLPTSPSGPPGLNPGLTRPTGSSLIPAHAGTSQSIPQPDPRFRGDERTLSNNPLYYDKLHSYFAPEPLWESAAEVDDERADLTALHLMAHGALIAAGFPTGPDPRLRLPDFKKWQPPDPPDPPRVRSFN